MKKWTAILLAVVLVVTMVGCGQTATTEEGMPKIGVTIYKFDDNFMSFVRRAIETAATDKAELILNDSQNAQATQNDQVDVMISKGVKALAINLVDPQAAQTIIDKAKAAELPVVFFNKEPDQAVLNGYDKAWYVGTKSEEAGIIQGEMIASMWQANANWDRNGDGIMQYVLLKGEPGHPDAEARTTFAIQTAVEKGLKVQELELQTGMWDAVKGKELMDAWLAKHGDAIEFVVANNDGMALGAIESLKGNGYFVNDKFMPVVGVDAIPDALQQIKDGFMVGTVLNDAKNQGTAAFELAMNAAMGKDVVEGTSWTLTDKAVRVAYVAVTKDNIAVGEEAYK